MNSKKLFTLMLSWAFLIRVPSPCQEPPNKADTVRQIGAMAWLVGGTWTADASKIGAAGMRIETRYQWSDNKAYIRFTTHFVNDKGAVHRYDGNFFWNPEQSTLAMWYMDPANNITQGPVKIDGDVLEMLFRDT